MNIKEAVKLTGLPDKTIRYYESEGLISVKRKANAYREYTDKNIQDLNTIVLLRYLSLSINEIKILMENPDQWEAMRSQLQITLRSKKKELDHQVLILKSIDRMSFLDISTQSTELLKLVDSEVIQLLESVRYPSLFDTVIETIILLGPVLWLLVGVYLEVRVNLKIALPLASISIILITLRWRKYHLGKNYQTKKASTIVSFLLSILVLFIGFGSIALVGFLQYKLFADSQTLLYVINYPILNYVLLAVTIALVGYTIFGVRGKYVEAKKSDYLVESYEIYTVIKKYIKVISVFLMLLIYTVITSVTIINKDGSLVRHGVFNLKGKHYGVDAIQEIRVGYNTGFFRQYRNDFYMVLKTKDFKVDIVQASVTEAGDTYSELVLLSEIYSDISRIVGNHDPKNCTLDNVYCDKFETIMGVNE